MPEMDKTKVVAVLNRLLEAELSGVVRYTHHLVAARASQPASDLLLHAQQIGGTR